VWSHEEVRGLVGDLFGGFGDIESISVSEFQQQHDDTEGHGRRNARFAHVVFGKRSAVRAALQAGDDLYSRLGRDAVAGKWGILHSASSSGEGGRLALSVKELQSAYANSVSPAAAASSVASELRAEADEFMRDFEEKERVRVPAYLCFRLHILASLLDL
jgi:hypothetical protein